MDHFLVIRPGRELSEVVTDSENLWKYMCDGAVKSPVDGYFIQNVAPAAGYKIEPDIIIKTVTLDHLTLGGGVVKKSRYVGTYV